MTGFLAYLRAVLIDGIRLLLGLPLKADGEL